MSKTIYSYTIIDPLANTEIVTELETRDDARQELALVKKVYPKAKIIQSRYKLEVQRQVR